ncbi:MAG: hypothetical protein Q9220_002569 [cf. Caloplaca sp. 1 TL-2023]
MADVEERSLAPKGSNESFHSSHSQPLDPLPNAASSVSVPVSTDLHAAALQAAGLSVYDVEAYLSNPHNQEVLASPPPAKKQKGNPSSSCTPVQLGVPITTHNVSALHQLCQERALVPDYEIHGDQGVGFGGTITVGGQVIKSENRWRNKKEAKEGLAELAVPVVREMAAAKRERSVTGEQEKNWVGMLLEYHNATDPTHTSPGATYTEYALSQLFACTCHIPHTPDTTFGSPSTAFPSKRLARNAAAKEAVQHLMSLGELNPDGSPTKTQKKKHLKWGSGPTVSFESGGGLEVKRGATYVGRVTELLPLLALPPPTYRFAPASASAPNMLSGAAYFADDDPLLQGAIGEVRNVFGKKNAKEECARGVWEVLRTLAESRGVQVREVD